MRGSNWWKLAFMVVWAIPGANADFRSAFQAYQEQKYSEAYAQFRELAELGHPQSQYMVGVLYYNGQGVSRNPTLAYGWIRLAANAGFAPAMDLEPRVRRTMDSEAVERSRALLDKFSESAVAERLLPKVVEDCEYFNATPPKKKKVEPPSYPMDALIKGVNGSVLLEFLIERDGTVRDVRIIEAIPSGVFEHRVRSAAFKWLFEPAMRDGKPFATWAEMYVYFKIDGSTTLTNEATKRLAQIKQQAEQGDPLSQYLHALIMAGHPQFQKPWSEVLPWLMKSAQGGIAPAQYRVGQSLLRGRGCEPDSGKAAEWLLRAAQQDHADAQLELAVLSLKAGPGYDPKKAMFWLERAVANGNHNAKKYLAGVLAASTVESLRDPTRALMLIDDVLEVDRDDIVAQEIRAAALAASGQLAAAVDVQTKALAIAKRRQWDLTETNARLMRYRAGETWHGEFLEY